MQIFERISLLFIINMATMTLEHTAERNRISSSARGFLCVSSNFIILDLLKILRRLNQISLS
jgi:hypothetical protein